MPREAGFCVRGFCSGSAACPGTMLQSYSFCVSDLSYHFDVFYLENCSTPLFSVIYQGLPGKASLEQWNQGPVLKYLANLLVLTQPGFPGLGLSGDAGGERPLHLTPLFWLNVPNGKILLCDSSCPAEVSVKRSIWWGISRILGRLLTLTPFMCLGGAEEDFSLGSTHQSVSNPSLSLACSA